ncbi:MAG: hypothetical protein QGH47_04060, partial [Candidatus Woesearchaeota archaeon]|nr:hypothetical protein [Candidatus Woesearchaeota archaeon]
IYLKAWLLSVVFSVVIGTVLGIVNTLLAATVVVPLILNGFSNMIIGITSLTLLGDAFRELK